MSQFKLWCDILELKTRVGWDQNRSFFAGFFSSINPFNRVCVENNFSFWELLVQWFKRIDSMQLKQLHCQTNKRTKLDEDAPVSHQMLQFQHVKHPDVY